MFALQQQNVKREVLKKIPIHELSKPIPNIDINNNSDDEKEKNDTIMTTEIKALSSI